MLLWVLLPVLGVPPEVSPNYVRPRLPETQMANLQIVGQNGGVLAPLKRANGFDFSRCGCKERTTPSEDGVRSCESPGGWTA